LVEPEPKWKFDTYICHGHVVDTSVYYERKRKFETRVSYYPDLQQDSKGFFTMTGRAVIKNDHKEVTGEEILWKQSKEPDNFGEWGPDVRCINHTGDSQLGRGWKKTGSVAHENIVLEDGKSIVFGMMTVNGVGKLYANIFNGEKWGKQDMELASGMSTWRGTDRRMCAVFDKKARILHLAYVDGQGNLFYRKSAPPYDQSTWTTPLKLKPFKTFTVVLSLDTEHEPAHVYLLYGKTHFEDNRDLRNTYGALYLQRFDGVTWSEPALVSEPGTEDNWYPNMNEDVKNGVGIVYLKGSGRTRKGDKPDLDIMFASTGTPIGFERQ
jgi:hypothetical protein